MIRRTNGSRRAGFNPCIADAAREKGDKRVSIAIKINDLSAVKKINSWAGKQKFEVYLHSANGNVQVNAKSYIGICALVGEESNLVIPDHVDEAEAIKALKELF